MVIAMEEGGQNPRPGSTVHPFPSGHLKSAFDPVEHVGVGFVVI